MMSKVANMTLSSNIFDVAVFLLSHLATGPRFLSISLLVLDLRQFSLIRDQKEIQKSGASLGYQIYLIKCY